MKRIFVLSVIPFALFALEKVNLIKDAGFEKNSGVWEVYVGRGPTHGKESAASTSTHDSERFFSGSYSGYSDTRSEPVDVQIPDLDSTVHSQGFCITKYVADVDSFILHYSSLPLNNDSNSTYCILFGLYLNAKEPDWRVPVYFFRAWNISGTPSYPPYMVMEQGVIPTDTSWHILAKKVITNLQQLGFSSSTTVDSLVIIGWGLNYPPWRGQKIYFDDIRLTGYADCDVGVKGILSRDSIGNAYVPTARIKNFGRKAADSFLVIAVIEGGSGVVYADTLSWSLAADTEDTVSFKEFKPSDAANYTLTISTFMTPDESDEDDAMSKTLYGTGVEEQPTPAGVVFNVSSFSSYPQVSYSLPMGEQGTISLYDPSGRRIESHTVIGSGRVIMNSALSSGVYFIKLETSQTTITRKAVVLR